MAATKTGFVEVSSPGFFFADIAELKVPKDIWDDERKLARYLRSKEKHYVGFRRIVYSSDKGKTYFDKGWCYFRGIVVRREDVVSGLAEKIHPTLKLTEIGKGNMINNQWDGLYLKDFGERMWQFTEDDEFVEPYDEFEEV